jgi:hypothetical protein
VFARAKVTETSAARDKVFFCVEGYKLSERVSLKPLQSTQPIYLDTFQDQDEYNTNYVEERYIFSFFTYRFIEGQDSGQ